MPFKNAYRLSLIAYRKKISFLVAFLIFLLITSHLSLLSAQSPAPTPALEKAQSDYTFQFTKYRDAQEKYISAKAQYQSFQTATAKNDAYAKTKDYLIQIDKLYQTYILLVQENGNAINFTKHGDDKNKINDILKNETNYLNNHIQKINGTKTLEELPPLSLELKKNLDEDFHPKLNKTFAIFEVVETEAALDDFESLSRILDRVVVFKLRAGETKSILNNWSSEIKDIRTKTANSIIKARDTLSKIPEDQASDGELTNISQLTQDAKRELKRSKPLFEEALRII